MAHTVQKACSVAPGRRGGMMAQQVFFPAAALFAAVAPWLLLLAPVAGMTPLVDVSTHARSMLIGYVGALIAGYLGGKLPAGQLALLFALWLLGRLAEVGSASPVVTNCLYVGFGAWLATLVVPRFRGAKKWRNRAIGPLIALICFFPVFVWMHQIAGGSMRTSLYSLLLLITLLMFFMGGRFITPVLARAYADAGMKIPQRVQPRLEAVVMLLLAGASLLNVLTAGSAWTALPAGLAALLLLLRLYRWKLFSLPQRADIRALGCGYLWLGVGLLVFSVAFAGGPSSTVSLHLITIGALGTLSSCVMLKQSGRAVAPPMPVYSAVTLLLFVAAVARFLVETYPQYRPALLAISGVAWSTNFLLVAFYTLITRKENDRG